MKTEILSVFFLTALFCLLGGSIGGCIYWITTIHKNFHAFESIDSYAAEYPYGRSGINFTAKAFFRYRCENQTCWSLYLNLFDDAEICLPYATNIGRIDYPQLTSTFLSCIDLKITANAPNASESIVDFNAYYRLTNLENLYNFPNDEMGGAAVLLALSGFIIVCTIVLLIIKFRA